MSEFTGPLLISFDPDNGRTATLFDDLVWEVGFKGSGVRIVVPAGFTSDGASVPRLLWALMPAWGDKGTRAAILHDYLLSIIPKVPGAAYRTDRKAADAQFYDALIALGVPKWRARLCWLGVRAYGTYYGWIGIYLANLSV